MYNIRRELLCDSFLAQFLCILREVVEEYYSSSSIGTCKEFDKWSKNDIGVFIR